MLLTAVPSVSHADGFSVATPKTTHMRAPINLFSADEADIMPLAVEEGKLIGDEVFTKEEIAQLRAATVKAIEDNIHPDNSSSDDKDLIQITIPFDIDAGTPRAQAAYEVIQNVFDDNPQYFYIDAVSVGGYTLGGKLFSVVHRYRDDSLATDAAKAAKIDEVDTQANSIIAQMYDAGLKNASDFDKALWLHDYLANTITYDTRAHSNNEAIRDSANRSLDTALLGDRTTVCHGYVGAYKYLLNKVGIDCMNVYSNVLGHVWSAVKIDGKWYHVDVTYDDLDDLGRVSHKMFMLTSEELKDVTAKLYGENRSESVWFLTESDKDIFSQESLYPDSVLRDIESPVAFIDGDMYYGKFDYATEYNEELGGNVIKSWETAVYKTDTFETAPEKIYIAEHTQANPYADMWLADTGSIIPAYYGGMGAYDGKLYFNTPQTLYKFNISGGASEPEIYDTYEPTSPDDVYAYWWGTYVADGNLYYYSDVAFGYDEEGYTVPMSYDLNEEELGDVKSQVYTVTFKDINKVIDTVIVDGGAKVEAPDYFNAGYVIEGWYTDKDYTDKWDFDTDTVTANTTLYVNSIEAELNVEGVLTSTGGRLTGEINVRLDGVATGGPNAPMYYLAVYDNGVLSAVRMSSTGEFKLTEADNIAYNAGTSTTKIFAWNGTMQPFSEAIENTYVVNYGIIDNMYAINANSTYMVKIIGADGEIYNYEYYRQNKSAFEQAGQTYFADNFTVDNFDYTGVKDVCDRVVTYSITGDGTIRIRGLADYTEAVNTAYDPDVPSIGTIRMSNNSDVLDLINYTAYGETDDISVMEQFKLYLPYTAYGYGKSAVDGSYAFVIVTDGITGVNMYSPLAVVTSVSTEDYGKGDAPQVYVYTDGEAKSLTVDIDEASPSVINFFERQVSTGDAFIYELNAEGRITDAMLILDMPDGTDGLSYSNYVNSIFEKAESRGVVTNGSSFDAALADGVPTALDYQNYKAFSPWREYAYFVFAPVLNRAGNLVNVATLDRVDSDWATYIDEGIDYYFDGDCHVYTCDWAESHPAARIAIGPRGSIQKSSIPNVNSLHSDGIRGWYINWAEDYGIGSDYNSSATYNQTDISFVLLKIYNNDIVDAYSIIAPLY